MKYIFGPVPSRRLGFSLGIDLVPFKTCSLNCIYCECGPTTTLTLERKEWVPLEKVWEELRGFLKSRDIDYLTFSGSGEPTLHSRIGELIRRIKENSSIPVALLTNGTLFYRDEVIEEVLPVDVILPSLDAGRERTFKKVNRPHPDLDFSKFIEGLVKLRKKYKGQIWLEVLFVKGFNDTEEEVLALKEIIGKIAPDKIQLNTVVRPPAVSIAQPVSRDFLERAKALLGDRAEIIAGRSYGEKGREEVDDVLSMLARRPETAEAISSVLGLPLEETERLLKGLEVKGLVEKVEHEGRVFYRMKG